MSVLSVSSSCNTLLAESTPSDIAINANAITLLCEKINSMNISSADATVGFPVNFESVEDEVNLWSTFALFHFGGVFDKIFLEETKSTSVDVIIRAILGVFLSGRGFNIDFYRTVNQRTAPTDLMIPVEKEVQVMPAVYETRPGPLLPFVRHLEYVCTTTSNILEAHGCRDFASFFKKNVSSFVRDGKSSVEEFVKLLVNTFPVFKDETNANRQEKKSLVTSFHSRAQHLAYYLYKKVGGIYNFDDINKLTCIADAPLVAYLCANDIILMSSPCSEYFTMGIEDEPKKQQWDALLRASAVSAVDLIAVRATALRDDGQVITPIMIDGFIRTIIRKEKLLKDLVTSSFWMKDIHTIMY